MAVAVRSGSEKDRHDQGPGECAFFHMDFERWERRRTALIRSRKYPMAAPIPASRNEFSRTAATKIWTECRQPEAAYVRRAGRLLARSP